MAKSFHLKDLVDYEPATSGFSFLGNRRQDEFTTRTWQFSADQKSLDESSIWKTALFLALKKPHTTKETQ